jgi:hypothetical protein
MIGQQDSGGRFRAPFGRPCSQVARMERSGNRPKLSGLWGLVLRCIRRTWLPCRRDEAQRAATIQRSGIQAAGRDEASAMR